MQTSIPLLEGKTVAVIGGTGSLGQALCERLRGANKLAVISRDELKQWTLRNELKDSNVSFIVGDMRDPQRLEDVLLTVNPHVVIIAAALKQVDTCEHAPSESIKTNILGVQYLVEVTERNIQRLSNLETIVMVSTDKACAPTNVYGMSKAIAERIVSSRCYNHDRIRFVVVRYGNVLESRGSIIPLFRSQAENAPAFTLTHPEMTRFIMTLDDSINLILTAVLKGESGTTWIPKLRSMKILDLAELFSRRYKKPIETIGLRPGEKLHEQLISEPESVRVSLDDGFYVMKPSLWQPPQDAKVFAYSSDDDIMSSDDLESYLDQLGILTASIDEFKGPKVESIRLD
jgi:FlaA1/EpsC-like NDP-sugar epimerase